MRNRTFSVTLTSKSHLTRFSLGSDVGPDTFLEGDLGEGDVRLLDDVLEVRGKNGIMYLDLKKEELKRILKQGSGGR